MKPIFPQIDGLIHGGDYNPEQWLDRPDILAEDIRLMREAGMNSASVGIFSWAALEPREGEFHMDWLVDIVDTLYKNGIYTVLATPSGARPAWLDEAYPEAMRVGPTGSRNHHGVRHNHCMSSPKYREKVEIIVRRLAEALGGHPGVVLWHISNELGGECWCGLCRARFVEYLRARYHGSIEELNKAWWTAFWSHQYNRFEQIEPPWPNGETRLQGLSLDWRRFTSWNMDDYLGFEADLLRALTPHIPITTNFMTLYDGLDYHALEKRLDVISWDSYPAWGTDRRTLCSTAAETAFHHSVMRGMKPGKPFLLMESVPSQVNWHPFNKVKRPGVHRLASLQAVALGSDSVQYFQWRKGRGAFEQHHGAVIDHLGTSDTRVFREVQAVGGMLGKLAPLAGSAVHAEAALLFDWDNRWAIQDMAGLSGERKRYEETCMAQHAAFFGMGVPMDVVSPLADLSQYKVVAAPMLYMLKPGVADKLRAYVSAGGRLVATYLTGYVDQSTLCWLGGFPGDGLTELFGLYAEEIDTLYPADRNALRCAGAVDGIFAARDFCEVVVPKGCEVIGRYEGDFYAGTPAVTRKAHGTGSAWYVAARLEHAGIAAIYRAVCREAGVQTVELPEDVEFQQRIAEGCRYAFYLNWRDEQQTIAVPPGGADMLTGAPAATLLALAPLGAAVIRYPLQ